MTDTQAETPPETNYISDVDQFGHLVVSWHQYGVQKVQQLLEVPEGTAFEIGEDTLVLSKDTLTGFKFGIEMAMMQLGTLPFLVEALPEAEPADAAHAPG